MPYGPLGRNRALCPCSRITGRHASLSGRRTRIPSLSLYEKGTSAMPTPLLQEVYNCLRTRGDGALYLEAYAWPGGYPLIYLCRDGEIVCPACAVNDVVYGEW